MKKYLWVVVLLAVLVIPAWQIAAQDDTTETLSMSDALAIVRDMVGTDLVLREVQYDDDESCWKFEFTDLTEICISDTTGEVVENPDDDDSPEATPEATPDADDSSDDDSNDDNSDDSSDDEIAGTATVTLEEAITTALGIFPDSIVTKIELEMTDDGLLVWDVELDGDVRSVDVNAETGSVLSFGYEANDDDDYVDDSNDDDDNSDSSNDDGDDDNSNDSDDDSDDDSNDDDSSDDDSSDDDNDDSDDSDDDESNDD